MITRPALVATLAAAVLGGTQAAAYAACPPCPVHMTVQVGAPRYGDHNDLIYSVRVANLGPGRATGLVVGRSTLVCTSATTPLTSCQRVPVVTVLAADLGPSDSATFPADVLLPAEGAVVVRTTVEVVRADQHDAFSVLGACQDGRHPQDACGTNVFQVTP